MATTLVAIQVVMSGRVILLLVLLLRWAPVRRDDSMELGGVILTQVWAWVRRVRSILLCCPLLGVRATFCCMYMKLMARKTLRLSYVIP